MQTAAMGEAVREARGWLFDHLLPFWVKHGQYPSGGFVEQIGRSGPLSLPLRLRVQARQIYVFAEAGRLGWHGPWRESMEGGISFALAHYLREDGLVRSKVQPDGTCVDDTADNYDQAFALFALAHAYRATGQNELRQTALSLLDRLVSERKHADGGFHEATPPVAPLRANPHMHLFEAMQAWTEIAGDERFRSLATEIAALCTERFIDPASGSLHEFFALDWSAAPGEAGRIVEPGHEFEWAWLFKRWSELGGTIDPAVPSRLYDHANRYGTDASRKVAINEIDATGKILDAKARLWPQTERLKAALIMGDGAAALIAWQGLKSYQYPDNPALYVDICNRDGIMVEGPAFASSLYHITCAISELARLGGN